MVWIPSPCPWHLRNFLRGYFFLACRYFVYGFFYYIFSYWGFFFPFLGEGAGVGFVVSLSGHIRIARHFA